MQSIYLMPHRGTRSLYVAISLYSRLLTAGIWQAGQGSKESLTENSACMNTQCGVEFSIDD
jgi:hypothetical protein